ncbi:tRNA lysidine(34) synthetase TilS [Kordiimonas sp.]|uniref:tRNA lysidine(34) synthetase TilS n=1 Tax=Kordiimonas sp. TaxID=1970157 RepID=UPI003A8D0943
MMAKPEAHYSVALISALKDSLRACHVPEGARLAVAVSGGADSLALALLLHKQVDIVALSVDHGLRSEAVFEVENVAEIMHRCGVPHFALKWQETKPHSNIQAEARVARYRLLGQWCVANRVSYLLTAHHRDDQAETLLMRLARGSGVYGLAAMSMTAPVPGVPDVTLIRPLLDVPKAALVNYLRAEGLEWAEDPSNSNTEFDRVKIREFLKSPPLEGFSSERLAETAKRLRRSRDALEYYEREWLASAVGEEEPGYLLLDKSQLAAAPEDIVLRGIASLCRAFAGGDYVPRMEKMERLLADLRTEGFTGATLHGVQFLPAAEGRVLICREPAACSQRLSLTAYQIWDKRFEISVDGATTALEIGGLGEAGWQVAVTKWPEVRETPIPYAVRLGLPAVFQRGQLRALPHMGYSELSDAALHLSRKTLIRSKK